MAYGTVIRPHHLPLLQQKLSSDSKTLLSATFRVSTRRGARKSCLQSKCIRGLLQSDVPVTTQRQEKAIKIKVETEPQVPDSNKIKQGLDLVKEKVQSVDDGNLSISAYDTAWVALVKDIHGSDAPLFPSCLDWIVDNQLPDGSWGDRYFFSAYDRLSCTLACVVALKTWNINLEGCEKGLSFLRQNLHRLQDEDPEHLLSGFEVTFPTLVEMAQKLGLQVLKDSPVFQDLLAKREQKLRRIPMDVLHNVPTTLLHSLEGIPDLDWDKLLKMQHPNGSFLCSPSSTAYALMQTKDENCFRYLAEIVQKFNGGVVHSYPMDLFERLWVVDRLERLGFSRYFKSEIKELLDYVYGCWTRNGISWSTDTIEFDIDDTCMGFRMLRQHGYDVNASAIQHFERDGEFFCFVGQNSQGITEMLSLYRASQVLFPGETILEEAKSFSSKFLRKKQDLGQVADRWLITKDLAGEVKYYMDVPWYANLPRIETRHYIDQYGGDDDVWIAKTLYRMLYEVYNHISTARAIFDKAVQMDYYRSVEEVVTLWEAWAEMEMVYDNSAAVLELIKHATTEPSAEEGTLESERALYERMLDLKITPTQIVVFYYARLFQGHNLFEEAFEVYERGIKMFKYPTTLYIWMEYLFVFVKRYGEIKLERARQLFDRALEMTSAYYAKPLYLQYAKLEEKYGLSERVLEVYDQAAKCVKSTDKMYIYRTHIYQSVQSAYAAKINVGVTKMREIYELPIKSGGILDKDVQLLGMRYAELEISLGEVDRARAIYKFTSQYADPQYDDDADFWRTWHKFEARHKKPSIFQKMLQNKQIEDFASDNVTTAN
ncbi:Copalyl diphosphate synthase [Thalictrum thalictroides]|uniref:Copalyl diphosphate synthase n=1 Tax=Thalictrum thalictroides TaxID=46969 RepID=A0A7J6UZJ6_THATH|nr:Copalyl diphosphate synthase [Thalictrum thalictroides]